MKKHVLFLILPFLLTSCSVKKVEQTENMEENVDYNKEEMLIYQGETKIYGNLFSPLEFNKDIKKSIVIMSHSANCNSDTHLSYALRAVKENYLAYTFDYPRGSNNSRSDSIEECTIFSEEETLTYIINYFKKLDYIDNIYLFGTSQGGLVSSIVGDTLKDDISGLILFYPAFNIPELIVSMPYGISENYLEQLKGYDVYSHIGKFEKDVLIVHGSSDFIVDKKYSEQAASLYKNCELHIVEGANHGFNTENYAFNNDYDEITRNYAKTYLNNHR